jgi:hypothetical protein
MSYINVIRGLIKDLYRRFMDTIKRTFELIINSEVMAINKDKLTWGKYDDYIIIRKIRRNKWRGTLYLAGTACNRVETESFCDALTKIKAGLRHEVQVWIKDSKAVRKMTRVK